LIHQFSLRGKFVSRFVNPIVDGVGELFLNFNGKGEFFY